MAVEVIDNKVLRSLNPANLEVLGEQSITSEPEILARVASAREAFASWGQLTVGERLIFIERFRRELVERRDALARLITEETGKPLIESHGAELFGPLETCSWLEKNAARLLKRQPVRLNPVFFLGKKSYNVFEPLGVVAVISPWNYAFSIPVSSMLTALAAGNTVILKPSPKTPLIARAIEDLFRAAGFPDGVVSVVVGDRDEARALVLADVDKVVFTGSVPGGRAIMAMCAQKLHPVTLELGGKHAAIVLADADVDKVARSIVWCAFTNAGQACASIERLYVEKPLARELSKRIAEIARGLRLGNGLSADTDVGPLIDAEQLARVQAIVTDAVRSGARVIAGGRARADLGGYFFEPTVLVNVSPQAPVVREEIFGPVLPIVVVENADEAVRLTNDTRLALGASIWTADTAAGERLARRIDAGMVWVNDGLYSHSCADAPWGGIKDSGFGRMHGAGAFHEFVYSKHVGVGAQKSQDWQYPYSSDRLALIRSAIELVHGRAIRRFAALKEVIARWLRTR